MCVCAWIYRDALHIIENETRGFFTGPGLDPPQARCIYLTAIQLLRIAGAQNSLRPMLEALFHRMLLLPLPQNRSDPLKCVKEIFRYGGFMMIEHTFCEMNSKPKTHLIYRVTF